MKKVTSYVPLPTGRGELLVVWSPYPCLGMIWELRMGWMSRVRKPRDSHRLSKKLSLRMRSTAAAWSSMRPPSLVTAVSKVLVSAVKRSIGFHNHGEGSY